MDNINRFPQKKEYSRKGYSYTGSNDHNVSAEQKISSSEIEAVSFEINQTLQFRFQNSTYHKNNDEVPTFEIFPDFSRDRSQTHYMVSPDLDSPPPLTEDEEFYIPIRIPSGEARVHTFLSGKSEEKKIFSCKDVGRASDSPDKSSLSIVSSEEKDMSFSFVSPENADALNKALIQLVCSEPLLSEDEILVNLKEKFPNLTKYELRNALIRNNLDSDYKRFRAYMAG